MIVSSVAGIYISWPFCAQKCTYCNFASGVMPKQLEGRYGQALAAEIASHDWQWQPETLYLGGGTPSAMEPGDFDRITGALPTTAWLEATIECAPGTVTADRITAWQRAGIQRVSLGVQSFVKAELARTGRRHDAATVERDIALLRSAGINNINIDLIAGLPGQTESSWRESLAAVDRLAPPHVSLYMLEVDDDSRLGAELLLGGTRYGASDVPGDDQIAAFYELAADELRRMGIERYEISNFARPGAESLHNLKYWRREPYVGFGADAHSFHAGLRWQNTESAADYVTRWQLGDPVRIGSTPAVAAEEKFFVGLRLTEGVLADASDWARYGATFDRFLACGVMERVGNNSEGRLRLTPRGIMISNEIFQEFVA